MWLSKSGMLRLLLSFALLNLGCAEVSELDSSMFEDALATNSKTLVMFYAPW